MLEATNAESITPDQSFDLSSLVIAMDEMDHVRRCTLCSSEVLKVRIRGHDDEVPLAGVLPDGEIGSGVAEANRYDVFGIGEKVRQ
jgi:hypothetical protein